PSLPSSHDPATLVIYTLSLHDALPIFADEAGERDQKIPGRRIGYYRQVCRYLFVGSDVAHIQKEALSGRHCAPLAGGVCDPRTRDRKSTRLNSSHVKISYAVFCLKKKK